MCRCRISPPCFLCSGNYVEARSPSRVPKNEITLIHIQNTPRVRERRGQKTRKCVSQRDRPNLGNDPLFIDLRRFKLFPKLNETEMQSDAQCQQHKVRPRIRSKLPILELFGSRELECQHDNDKEQSDRHPSSIFKLHQTIEIDILFQIRQSDGGQ